MLEGHRQVRIFTELGKFKALISTVHPAFPNVIGLLSFEQFIFICFIRKLFFMFDIYNDKFYRSYRQVLKLS